MKILPEPCRGFRILDRRRFLALGLAGLAGAEEQITRPVVSEEACPLEPVAPAAGDGHRGQGFLRKPPGPGPFPVILWIHGGLVTRPPEQLQASARGVNPSRFLAAGYVVLAPTYRSRDHDPQSRVSLEDCLAHVDHVRRLPFVDPKSIVVFGCSGGGDLALEIAAATTQVCAIVPEEPASFIFAGIFNGSFPKKGERLTPADSRPIGADPKRYYTAEYQRITRAKIAKIQCPILMILGDQNWVVPFNEQVLIPELRAAGKALEVVRFPGEPHCFCFQGDRRHAAALKAFRDTDAFCRRYIATKPRPLESRLVEHVPV